MLWLAAAGCAVLGTDVQTVDWASSPIIPTTALPFTAAVRFVWGTPIPGAGVWAPTPSTTRAEGSDTTPPTAGTVRTTELPNTTGRASRRRRDALANVVAVGMSDGIWYVSLF